MLKLDVDGENVQPKALADDIKDVLANRSKDMNVDMRFMPDIVPVTPAGGIEMKPMNFGPVSYLFLQCSDGSIANISSGRSGSSGLGQSDAEQYTACIFPFSPDGVGRKFRVVVGFRYTESSSGGISGALASGINSVFAKGMSKEEMGQVFFQQIEDGIMAKYPSTVVVDKQSL
ncbi:MAG: hypothetical protein L0Z73_04050 [Gammaproteobacteria bacterium]|nr:hypothetical protein [Gammaproteobacteria bacterium]